MTYNDGANKISEIHFYQYIYYIFIRYSHFNLLLLLQSLLWLTNGILVNLVSIQKKVSVQREKKSLIKFFDRSPGCVFVRLLHCRLNFFLPLSYCIIWKKVTMCNSQLRSRELCRIIWKSAQICLLLFIYLFNCVFISVYRYLFYTLGF